MTADENGDVYVTYSVWKKTQPAAGSVILGAPFPTGDPKFRAMYGIAIKEAR